MKKITIKKIIVTLMAFVLAGSAMAASLSDPSGLDVLHVAKNDNSGSFSGWNKSSVSVEEGDDLFFNIHYFVNGGTVSNIHAKLEDLRNRNFSDGDSENVSAFVNGDSVSKITDSVSVNFRDNVNLRFEAFSFQEGTCQSKSCETAGGSSGSVFSSNGYRVGTKSNRDYGNVVVKFSVVGENGNNNDDADVITNSASSVEEDEARLNGRVEGGDLRRVWFVISRSDSTPSCSTSSIRESIDRGGHDEDDTFSADVRGLREDTTYYFRACGENQDYDDVSGSVKSFRTDDEDDDDNGNKDLSDPSGLDVLHVAKNDNSGSFSGWNKSSVSVEEGDDLFFNIHYFVNGGTVSNIHAKLEDLRNRNFSDGDSENVSAFVNGDSVSKITDSVSVNFRDNVNLRFEAFSFQEGTCQSKSCETAGGSSGSVFSSNGYRVGTKSNRDYGNVVVKFSVVGENGNNNDDADVITNSASSVEEDEARLNGRVEGGDLRRVWFVISRSDSTPSCSTSSIRESIDRGGHDEDDTFSADVRGLREDTTYYFRACGENQDYDDVSGSVRSFRTDDEDDDDNDDADVITNSASSVEEDEARLNGRVEGGDLRRVWFVISRSDSTPSCSTSSIRESIDRGGHDEDDTFSADVRGLREDTTYYFRACGENQDYDDVSGSVRSFRTDDEDDDDNDDADVITNSASSVEEDEARLNGRVEGGDLRRVWFVISRSDSTPSCSTSSIRESIDRGGHDEDDTFSADVRGLREDTTYYFRACGENQDYDDVSGSVRSFRTDDEDDDDNDDADVITNSASSVEEDEARLNGRVEGGDLRRVWFVISRSDSTPSCSTSSIRESIDRGGHDEDDTFSADVRGLREDTTYYFRACGENQDYDDVSGSVRSFRTDDEDGGFFGGFFGGYGEDDFEIVTNEATNITTTSAQFNGFVSIDDLYDPEVYFIYGLSPTSLNSKTQNLGINSDTNFQSVTSLSSNTRYYFQAVLEEDEEVVDKGIVRTFTTLRAIYKPTPKPAKPSVTPVVEIDKGVFVDKEVSQERSFGYRDEIDAVEGDIVYYRVRVVNNSGKTINDIKVTDSIPSGLELSEDTNYNESDKLLVWEIDQLKDGDSRIFITEIMVSDNVSIGQRINSAAEVKYKNKTQSTNSVRINIEKDRFPDEDKEPIENKESVTIVSNGFFPNTAFSWLGIIAFIVLIAFLIAKIFSEKRYMREAELEELKKDEYNKLN